MLWYLMDIKKKRSLAFRIFKIFSLSLLSIIILIIAVGVIFVNTSPEFGGSLTEEQKTLYARSVNYQDGIFINQIPTPMDMSFGSMLSTLREFIKSGPNREPSRPIQVQKPDLQSILNKSDDLARVTWFGHSAFLMEIQGMNLLIDPMFGDVPAPHPLLGSGRYSEELPISIEDLPNIDAVFLSHDHYDHLDYGSIVKLKDKVDEFYVPLGVKVHLQEWNIEESKIHELDWWDEIQHDSLKIVFAPSRHFSGRGVTGQSETLWGSWIIQSSQHNIYFSGDSGYGPHFKEIGDKFGPFDFAMLECGQYNERWRNIHLMPEETVTAAIDLQANLMMPIHWGSFTLALHDWTDPVERATKEANRLNVPITTPEIGEPIDLNSSTYPQSAWWLDY